MKYVIKIKTKNPKPTFSVNEKCFVHTAAPSDLNLEVFALQLVTKLIIVIVQSYESFNTGNYFL